MNPTLEERATLTIIENTLDPGQAERTTMPLKALGSTVREVLPEHVKPDGTWVVVENGGVLSPEDWHTRMVMPHTELICYPRMSGAVGRMIAGGVLIAAGVLISLIPGGMAFGIPIGLMGLGMIAGGVVDLLMGPPKAAAVPSLASGDQSSSATYGFGGLRT
jgi:hypothetical protein